MKRLFSLMIAILVGIGAGALAEQLLTQDIVGSIIPQNAQFLRTENDDGYTEHDYTTPDGTRWEVRIDPVSGNVVKVDIEVPGARGSASAVLTTEQAEAKLLELWPDASVYLITPDRDDGGHEYDVFFTTEAFSGRAELNAETGALIEAELDYSPETRVRPQGALSADEAKALVLSLVTNGQIVEFETDRENGRKVYEGEVKADGMRYEFVIDADTGRVLEWENDR